MEIPGISSGSLDPGAGRALRQIEGFRTGGIPRMSGRELRDFVAEQRRIALDELQAFAAALTRDRETRASVEAELAHAWGELLQLLLPSLDGALMEKAATRFGLAEMELGALGRRSQARQAELVAELAALDRRPRVVEAARACDDIDVRRRHLDERLERLGQTLDALEAEPLFFRLIAARYDTPDYQGRFWQGRFHRHKRQAAELVARHGATLGARRFWQLYKRYVFEKATYDRLALARGALLARLAEVAALARRRSEMETELSALPEWELAYARARIRAQITQGEEANGLGGFMEDPVLGPAASAVVTLEARLRSLATLRAECLDEPRVEAERALTKVEEVLGEFRTPARKLDAVHLREEMERAYALPLSRWRDLRHRYEDLAGQPS